MAEVRFWREGPIGHVVFSNPPRLNAMTLEMWRALPGAVAALDADPEVRVIVCRGDGERAFISGADISQFERLRATVAAQAEYERALEEAYRAPMKATKPVLASIRGVCMGGGLGFAAACDLRIAADDVAFRMPAARLGLGYSPAGVRRFVHLIGAANTADIFFSARTFDAADAHHMGFVNRVVPAAALDGEVEAYCRMIGENAPLSLAASKAAIRAVLADPADRDLAALDRMVDECYRSEDYREGRTAFMEKRTPRFKGA